MYLDNLIVYSIPQFYFRAKTYGVLMSNNIIYIIYCIVFFYFVLCIYSDLIINFNSKINLKFQKTGTRTENKSAMLLNLFKNDL